MERSTQILSSGVRLAGGVSVFTPANFPRASQIDIVLTT
jgi:hypothetical protein